MSEKQERMLNKMQEVLQEDFLKLSIKSYTLKEDLETGTSRISCALKTHGHDDETMVVEGEGVGTIDAVFNALKTKLADEYPSLRSIKFFQFAIEGLFEDLDVDDARSAAHAKATVGILNSEGREFVFTAKAPSTSQAGISATLQAAEYFINSERTFVKLYDILDHYRSKGRTDLVQKYTTLMTEVVENTSYSEVVEKIRSQM